MLNLKLRPEFSGPKIHGTMVDFTNPSRTGALDISAEKFLNITYPSIDLLLTIESILPSKRKPVVILGEKGQGKSHLMAVLFHVLNHKQKGIEWLERWKSSIDRSIELESMEGNFLVIAENLKDQNYNSLWDILFDKHPDGAYFRGKWESAGEKKTPVPSAKIIQEMLERKPVALLLDEFQTWFEGKSDTPENPARNHAFNFIQILSEIGALHPNLLILVVSVRDASSESAQQVYRINPSRIAFNNPNTKKDRLRLILYRIFENRLQIGDSEIQQLIQIPIQEFIRLKEISSDKVELVRSQFLEAWPFSHELIRLLEDQVLVSLNMQETRDLILILVELFKHRGNKTPILTPADFLIQDTKSTADKLLDSIANREQRDLKEKALRNLEALQDIQNKETSTPHSHEILSALWFRSLSAGKIKGAKPIELQIDITKESKLDDNAFQRELIQIEENSFNIHKEGEYLLFKNEENLLSKLFSSAKNDKQFLDEREFGVLLKIISSKLTPMVSNGKVIPLGREWETRPWDIEKYDPSYKFENWEDKDFYYIVIPENSKDMDRILGKWLAQFIPRKRNKIRFLLPRSGEKHYCYDRDLQILSRVVKLSEEWKGEYLTIANKYKAELEKKIKDRFDTYAVLEKWNFEKPELCAFIKEKHGATGEQILEKVEERIKTDLFAQEDFEEVILQFANSNASLAKIKSEFQEPISPKGYCIPWIRGTILIESIYRMCAEGKISIHNKGTEILQLEPGEEISVAYNRMKPLIADGRDLEITKIFPPNPMGKTVGVPEEKPKDSFRRESEEVKEEKKEIPNEPSIFTPPKRKFKKEFSFNASLNLINELERSNIPDKEPLESITIVVDAMDKIQLRRLLEKLPTGFQYKLEFIQEEKP